MRTLSHIPIALSLVGCADPGEGVESAKRLAATAHAADRVDGLLMRLQPAPLVELVADPPGVLGLSTDCQVPPPPGALAAWAGPCIQGDGSQIVGELVVGTASDGDWLSASGFELIDVDGLAARVDGAISTVEQGEYLILDLSGSWCGLGGVACTEEDPRSTVSWTVFPAAALELPLATYDATVSGAIDLGDEVLAVEAAWSVDEAVCPDEPASGTFALAGAHRQSLSLDGATACDGCGAWRIGGRTLRWCSSESGAEQSFFEISNP